MKAKQINGQIVQYKRLPSTYTKSDGSVILNFRNADTATLEAEGFYDVYKPTYNSKTKELGDIEWDSDSNRFTYPVINKTFSETLAEMKTAKIESLKSIYNNKLSATDWIIVRDQELGNTTSQSVLDDRAALRTECSTKEAEINAKTTKAQVADYTLPSPI